jgi:NTP pyrophosphatase (non-canonical NTP hydrolase)
MKTAIIGGKIRTNEYQKLAARTLIDKPDIPLSPEETMIIWTAIGLAGEAGEVVDDIKKSIFHRHGLDHTRLQKEIGDVLWYVAALCTTLGLDMETIMHQNIEKLKKRYPNGYSSEDSQKRIDIEKYFKIKSSHEYYIGVCTESGKNDVLEEEPDVTFVEISKEEFRNFE